MTALGFASGLPNALIVGSLSAWLSNAKVDLTTIGIVSWITLAYAFKFLWAPLVDWSGPAFLKSVGRRRLWLIFSQSVIAACFLGLSKIDPRVGIGTFAGLAALAAFFSATQDVVIDTWRIETSSDKAPLDVLSTRYQLGYRIAAFTGGAFALLLADAWRTAADLAAGWPRVFIVMTVFMALTVVASALAPEPLLQPRKAPTENAQSNRQAAKRRVFALTPVLLGWLWAASSIIGFMVSSLTSETPPNVGEFQIKKVPLILFATTGLPLILAYILVKRDDFTEVQTVRSGFYRVTDTLYSRILEPLVEIAGRFGVWAMPVLAMVMTYRISDAIWGAFANPFYLNVLGHSNADVALASKMVGVIATILGITLSGVVLLRLGRITALIIGAIIAALTNLLYADLAVGAPALSTFLAFTGIGPLFEISANALVTLVKGTGATILDGVTTGPALAHLTAAIFIENIAGGFAGSVYVAWLSSIVNKKFAAVQYALLSSLTLLISSIFRPRIGNYIDTVGAAGPAAKAAAFYDVFVFSTAIGFVAVALCVVEWWRQRLTSRKLHS